MTEETEGPADTKSINRDKNPQWINKINGKLSKQNIEADDFDFITEIEKKMTMKKQKY